MRDIDRIMRQIQAEVKARLKTKQDFELHLNDH